MKGDLLAPVFYIILLRNVGGFHYESIFKAESERERKKKKRKKKNRYLKRAIVMLSSM